jgi:hypothetical protein
MKRLVWLLLAAFCTAIAQVQPVQLPVAQAETCPCCDSKACDMPDCNMPPAPAQPARTQSSPVLMAVREVAVAPCEAREKFYVQFLPRPARPSAERASQVVAPAASVPLFKAHCSFLI